MHKNLRDRALLNCAYEFECYLQIDGLCETSPCEPCHSNQSIHGKGGSMKAHDIYHVPGCRACHHELDQGSRFNRKEKFEVWTAAFWRYLPDLIRHMTGR